MPHTHVALDPSRTDKHGKSLVHAPGRPRTRRYRKVLAEGEEDLEKEEAAEAAQPEQVCTGWAQNAACWERRDNDRVLPSVN